MITILGPTASGKTSLAVHLAYRINGEVISADSRQVYREMTIGTGKDLSDYIIEGQQIPYHLVDICEPGEEYNLFRFLNDFRKVFREITERNKEVILCGGSGMYIEGVLRGYNLVEVPLNQEFRNDLDKMDIAGLTDLLRSLGPLHATTDIVDRERLVKAIEQRVFYRDHHIPLQEEEIDSIVFGISYPREIQRQKITERLNQRLREGMIEEVALLIEKGVDVKQLMAYGLEYKWIAMFLTGQCSRETMVRSLNTAIHQFSKRQMTWFRKMERNRINIQWIDARLSLENKLNILLTRLNK
ncbi:MAG: tRNA (adenosine(37)-N6)-dimethylallyltransferase MiaA [Bacteroidetes bacterium]|nr:tRNA (adenosine(37)-N6)-dimethylallyltransferase MiaA [Bacteroidota bacterium]